MSISSLFREFGPNVAIAAAVPTAAVLVFAIYMTRFDLQWGAFLTGILLAGILSLVDRTLRAEHLVTNYSAKLVIAQFELEREKNEREALEEQYLSAKARLQFIDEAMPFMLAYVDDQRRCRHHSRAFAAFVRLPPDRIDGRLLRDVLGHHFYSEIEHAVDEVLEARTFYVERTRRMPEGAIYHLLIQCLPRFASEGSVTGFYVVLTDITDRRHVGSGGAHGPADALQQERGEEHGAGADTLRAQEMLGDSIAERITGRKDAAQHIVSAIENDEFTLFCQLIRPLLGRDSGQPGHYEILVRLIEEEQNLLPPGAFFPLAEKHGLMPHLDRWVVEHVLKWASPRKARNTDAAREKCFVNVAAATISDPDFPEFVLRQLQRYDVPGSTLCFEMRLSDVTAQLGDAAEFARSVKTGGCRIALSDYGVDRASLNVLKHVPADFIKIDGGIVLNIVRDPVQFAKVASIGRMAKAIGVRTIGELVEDGETIARLQEADIDFAQGYGISRPRPLEGVAE